MMDGLSIKDMLHVKALTAALTKSERNAVRVDLDYTLKNAELDAAFNSIISQVPGSSRLSPESIKAIKARARAALRVTSRDQMDRMAAIISEGVDFELAYNTVLEAGRLNAIMETIAHQIDENVRYNLHGEAEFKIWRTQEDNRVRDAHAAIEGQVRKMGEPFDVWGEECQYPGSDSLSSKNRINCRCYSEYK